MVGNTVIVRGGSVESLASGNVFGCGRPEAATTAYQDVVYPLPKQLDEKVNSTFLHAVRSSLPLLSLLRCQS